MYIVDLTYLKPLEELDVHLVAHREFLDTQYARGIVLASGPKNPRNGGILLVSGQVGRDELDQILAADPFHQHGMASYQVIDFAPVKHAPELANIL